MRDWELIGRLVDSGCTDSEQALSALLKEACKEIVRLNRIIREIGVLLEPR